MLLCVPVSCLGMLHMAGAASMGMSDREPTDLELVARADQLLAEARSVLATIDRWYVEGGAARSTEELFASHFAWLTGQDWPHQDVMVLLAAAIVDRYRSPIMVEEV